MDPQELLKRVKRRGRDFGAARFLPDRAYNPLLQSLLKGETTETRELNGRLIRMASEVGIDAAWNWRLTQRLDRVRRVGFYRNPAELYQAVKL